MYIVKGRMWADLPTVELATFRWYWMAKCWLWWLRQGTSYQIWMEKSQ